MKKRIIAPSILSADFSNIISELHEIKDSNADWVHLDVMDGSFVQNITFGPKFIKDIRKHSDLIFDTHLMINNPEKYIKEFANAGSNYITIHYESCKNVPETLNLIRSFGCKVGVAINPNTNVSEILPFLDLVDLVLIMTVYPGFGGQSLIVDCLEKINVLQEVRGSRQFLISVDGGINIETYNLAVESGVDILVTGSAFFSSKNKKSFVEQLKS